MLIYNKIHKEMKVTMALGIQVSQKFIRVKLSVQLWSVKRRTTEAEEVTDT
jgi:hypothetical protein